MATQIQGRASVLESEIKQDAGKGNTEKKEEELAELQQRHSLRQQHRCLHLQMQINQ